MQLSACELETIVLKVMEKDKSRRYPSAADFAADINRYLRGEPIAAKRDSTLYLRERITAPRLSVGSAAR